MLVDPYSATRRASLGARVLAYFILALHQPRVVLPADPSAHLIIPRKRLIAFPLYVIIYDVFYKAI